MSRPIVIPTPTPTKRDLTNKMQASTSYLAASGADDLRQRGSVGHSCLHPIGDARESLVVVASEQSQQRRRPAGRDFRSARRSDRPRSMTSMTPPTVARSSGLAPVLSVLTRNGRSSNVGRCWYRPERAARSTPAAWLLLRRSSHHPCGRGSGRWLLLSDKGSHVPAAMAGASYAAEITRPPPDAGPATRRARTPDCLCRVAPAAPARRPHRQIRSLPPW